MAEVEQQKNAANCASPPELEACAFIRLLGEDLDLPTTCTCSALFLYHSYRAAQANSALQMHDTDGKSLFTSAKERAKSPVVWAKVEAGACVLVSTKANDIQRKVRDVVNVVYQRALPDSSPLDVGNTFWNLRDALVASEQDVSGPLF